jgi:hypothetical protein
MPTQLPDAYHSICILLIYHQNVYFQTYLILIYIADIFYYSQHHLPDNKVQLHRPYILLDIQL